MFYGYGFSITPPPINEHCGTCGVVVVVVVGPGVVDVVVVGVAVVLVVVVVTPEQITKLAINPK